jgi:hypothetical protein
VRRGFRFFLIGIAALAVVGGGVAAAVLATHKHRHKVHAVAIKAPAPITETETATAPPQTTTPAPTATEAAPPQDDPDFDRLAGQVRRQYGFQDGADLATFALLYDHLKTGHVIPLSVAMASLDRSTVPYRYRLAGYMAFWQQNYGGVNWQRFPMDERSLLQMYDAYSFQQVAARQNRINQSIGAMVASEEAWESTMQQIRARDAQIATQEYVSDVQYEAERAVQRAQSALSR